MTHHQQAAEDLVQDTLERAYRHFGRYQPGTNIRAWLLRVMTNLHIGNCRRLAAAPSFTSVDMTVDSLLADHVSTADGGTSDVEARTVDRLAEEAILATIDALPPRLRAVVRLACVEGLPGRSIADTLGIPLGTVGSRLHRARYRLRHALRNPADPQLRVLEAA
jgi:RNA polymerase sigma-70 factor (ECF subfamily)